MVHGAFHTCISNTRTAPGHTGEKDRKQLAAGGLFPGDALLEGHGEPAELSTCITREDGGPGLTWPSSRNSPPSLHLCFVLLFFFFRSQIR